MSTGRILINPQFLNAIKNKANTISVFGVLFTQSEKSLSQITTDDFNLYLTGSEALYAEYISTYHTIIRNDVLKTKIAYDSIPVFRVIFLTYSLTGDTTRANQQWAFAVTSGMSGFTGDIAAVFGAGMDVEVDMNNIEGLCCRFINFNYPTANSYFHKHWVFNLYDSSVPLNNLTNNRDLLDSVITRLGTIRDTLHLTSLGGVINPVNETLIASDGNVYNAGVGVSIVKNVQFYNDPNNLAIIKSSQIARNDATDVIIKKQP